STTVLIGPRTSFRTGGIRSASSRIRASSESRPSVSKSHGSGSWSGESRCGAFIAPEHGLTDADTGTLIWESLLMCFIRGTAYDFCWGQLLVLGPIGVRD